MSIEFFHTVMGHRFYEGTMPKLADTMVRIADALEKLAAKPEATPAEPPKKPTTAGTPAEIKAVRRRWHNGLGDTLDIDDDAQVSRTDDGAWVSAWVWVDAEEIEEEKEEVADPPLKRPIIDAESEDVICPECSMRNTLVLTQEIAQYFDVLFDKGELVAEKFDDGGRSEDPPCSLHCHHCNTQLDPTEIEFP